MVKIRENPIKMDDLGYHYFWKYPYEATSPFSDRCCCGGKFALKKGHSSKSNTSQSCIGFLKSNWDNFANAVGALFFSQGCHLEAGEKNLRGMLSWYNFMSGAVVRKGSGNLCYQIYQLGVTQRF